MKAVRLYGPKELRCDECADPGLPAGDEVLIRVRAVGICGSDLHLYESGRIGDIAGTEPLVPGHEFMGEVMAAGAGARDGFGRTLEPGMRVAVDPHVPCRRCEWCENGHPNLCPHHRFFGLPGLDGALRERMVVPARNCFPLPDTISDGGGALLEPLGVAVHALDLGKGKFGRSAVVVGCGPVGLLIVRLARLAGLSPIAAVDPNGVRAQKAKAWGATHVFCARAEDERKAIAAVAGDRGFDLVFEAAWVGRAADACAEFACPGGRIVLVGVPPDDGFSLTHSLARRKGLTLLFSRRMKHVYARTIALASGPSPRVGLDELISHRFRLEETARAFALNLRYGDGIIKAVVELP